MSPHSSQFIHHVQVFDKLTAQEGKTIFQKELNSLGISTITSIQVNSTFQGFDTLTWYSKISLGSLKCKFWFITFKSILILPQLASKISISSYTENLFVLLIESVLNKAIYLNSEGAEIVNFKASVTVHTVAQVETEIVAQLISNLFKSKTFTHAKRLIQFKSKSFTYILVWIEGVTKSNTKVSS